MYSENCLPLRKSVNSCFVARDALKLVPYFGKDNSVLSDCMVKKP